MRWLMFVLKFLLIGALFIVSNNNLALIDSDDRQAFYDESGKWLKDVTVNFGELTAFVVKVKWLPRDNLGSPRIFDSEG